MELNQRIADWVASWDRPIPRDDVVTSHPSLSNSGMPRRPNLRLGLGVLVAVLFLGLVFRLTGGTTSSSMDVAGQPATPSTTFENSSHADGSVASSSPSVESSTLPSTPEVTPSSAASGPVSTATTLELPSTTTRPRRGSSTAVPSQIPAAPPSPPGKERLTWEADRNSVLGRDSRSIRVQVAFTGCGNSYPKSGIQAVIQETDTAVVVTIFGDPPPPVTGEYVCAQYFSPIIEISLPNATNGRPVFDGNAPVSPKYPPT